MDDDAKSRTRRQILEAAAGILEREGAQAVSTRSVAAAAGIRAASLYQLFGDKDGLLAALAVHAFDLYLAEKRTLERTDDPVADMRRGWDVHVDFGLRHPAFYVLMFGTDRPGHRPHAADQAHDLLLTFLDRAAAAGRLRVPPPLAAQLFLAAATGVTLSLLAVSARERDLDASTRMREMLVAALTEAPDAPGGAAGPVAPGLAPRALALDAALAEATGGAGAGGDGRAEDAGGAAPGAGTGVPLSATETALLRDWLHRLAR
ncbi:TetR/AcrR family transcriptional regulator [Actinacidiphila sp. DG2A-62]|uniref:TetR/AcrR family transcriptional regulator n=1 Tax=Actinacidiphila sp. DG2A-62 TaxID=3108821 RepID=UPI002DB66AFB|nr:TetR/AcrR family transcriptional regulator [Actinacidiphila sp. DG2A-62]MEC3992406.1 TetR/AcrR family transcriptional regulator [Actinacidiphila sp. DG2A-62]